jgi:RimJ/RimL family protein N-acetyltransferase
MQITTERLVLREFVEGDWPVVLAYQTDPRYLRFYGWTGRTAYDVRDFVQMFIDQQQEQPRRKHQLAITLKPNRQLIGNVGIRRKNADDWEADIGYELAPEHWGRGYATEAARAILAFGFDDLKLHRVWAWCIAENTASVRVLEKIGMRLEGRLRENEWIKNRWYDSLVYAILDREWQAIASSLGPQPSSF